MITITIVIEEINKGGITLQAESNPSNETELEGGVSQLVKFALSEVGQFLQENSDSSIKAEGKAIAGIIADIKRTHGKPKQT